ncbi:MAG: glycosyltransferase [Solirubrobacterales bacterium]
MQPSSPPPCGAELLTGGSIEPERMPLWINAANAVIVTSDYEGFGLAAVEALACDVPVLATPVGIAPYALGGIGAASALPSRSPPGLPWRAATSRRRTPGSPGPRGPRRFRRPEWPSA